MASTRECRTLKRNFSLVVKNLGSTVDPAHFARKLNEVNLVTSHIVDRAGVVGVLTPAQRIELVVTAVLSQIELRASLYHKFIDVVQEFNRLLAEVLGKFYDLLGIMSGVADVKSLGHQLDLDPVKLNKLQQGGGSPEQYAEELLVLWREKGGDPSWEKLARALKRMEENEMARTIEEKYVCCHGEGVTTSHTSESTDMGPPPQVMPQKLETDDKGGLTTEESPRLRPMCACDECSYASWLERGCPHAADQSSQFKHLDMRHLNPRQQQALQAQLQYQSEEMTFKFSTLVNLTIRSLETQNTSVERLATCLGDLRAYKSVYPQKPTLMHRLDEIRQANSILKVFEILEEYRSFFNYRIVRHVISILGTQDDEKRLDQYEDDIQNFLQRKVFECPADLYAPREGSDKCEMILKLGEEAKLFSMRELRRIQAVLADILHLNIESLMLCYVTEGCLQLTFEIPTFVEQDVFPLNHAQEKALQSEGVQLLTCGTRQYFAEMVDEETEVDRERTTADTPPTMKLVVDEVKEEIADVNDDFFRENEATQVTLDGTTLCEMQQPAFVVDEMKEITEGDTDSFDGNEMTPDTIDGTTSYEEPQLATDTSNKVRLLEQRSERLSLQKRRDMGSTTSLESGYCSDESNLSQEATSRDEDRALDFAARLHTNSTEPTAEFFRAILSHKAAAALRDGLNHNQSLRELKLFNCKISTTGVAALATALSSNTFLKTLRLQGCGLTDDSMVELFQGLLQNKALEELDLSSSGVGEDNTISSRGATSLAAAFRSNKSLKTLNLWKNHLGDQSVCSIAEALAKNETLQSLNLGRNEISTQGATAIARLLETNSSIKTLDLGWNNLGDQGVCSIAEALAKNETLQSLDLTFNNITDVGISALSRKLQINKSLQHLVLSLERLGDGGDGVADEGVMQSLVTTTSLTSLKLMATKHINSEAMKVLKNTADRRGVKLNMA